MKKIKTIVVDDSPQFLDYVWNHLLSIERLQPLYRALSVEEALQKSAEFDAVELVLMDVMMPGINGFEGVALFKKSLHSPKVILFSMHDSAMLEQGAAEAGADAFIEKQDIAEALAPLVERFFPRAEGQRA